MHDSIVYVTRDIERALGAIPSSSFQVITNDTKYSQEIASQYPEFVHLTKSTGLLDTVDLLRDKKNIEIIKSLNARVLVFKNNSQIEGIAKEHGFEIINPDHSIAERIENKLSQVEWLGSLAKQYMPEFKISPANEIKWHGEPIVLQWAHGHTGESTILIETESQLREITQKFPERIAKCSRFVKGPTFTVNIVADKSNTNPVRISNVSYQITGLRPFTEKQFSTIGNDWSLPHSLLSPREIDKISSIAKEIGTLMIASGWKGLFGIDLIRDDERDQIHLIEINARQPASTTYESQLQSECANQGVSGDTIFQAHIDALTRGSRTQDIPIPHDTPPTIGDLIFINDGAQIVKRVSGDSNNQSSAREIAAKLRSIGLKVIEYSDSKPNAEDLRIQSSKGIMETHGKFNTRGKAIADMFN